MFDWLVFVGGCLCLSIYLITFDDSALFNLLVQFNNIYFTSKTLKKMKAKNFFTYIALFGVAVAQSPHFVGKPSASIGGDGFLTVSFKEAGLGANQNINYAVTADFAATFQCCNNGGKHPKAGNKETTTGNVAGTGTFNSGQNGNIQGSIKLSTGPSPGDFTCPSGQDLLLTSLAYSNIVLTDTTTPVSINVANPSPVAPQTCSR